MRSSGGTRPDRLSDVRPQERVQRRTVEQLVVAWFAGSCSAGGGTAGCWVSGSGPGRKRIRLNRKTPAHLAGIMIHSRPRVWKRLCHVGFSSVSIPDHKRRRGDQANGGSNPAQVRTGVG